MSYIKVQYRIMTYDIVQLHLISYVIIRYRNLIYDVVYKVTISYNDIRYRIMAYNITSSLAMWEVMKLTHQAKNDTFSGTPQ